jgi:quercetin dioxygenase-like cupin family protein
MNKHEDERGIIEDLKVGKDWSVTYISFKKGAVRGNHYHKETKQVDIVLSGKLLAKYGNHTEEVEAGHVLIHNPKTPHAYKAIENSEMVSMCKGVRIGENYEEDTFRLETPLI